MNFVIITFSLIAGILLGNYVGGFIAVCFLGTVGVIFCIMKLMHKKTMPELFFCALAICLGIISFRMTMDNGVLCDYEGKYITIIGRIDEVKEKEDGSLRYVLDSRELTYQDKTEDIKEKIIITSSEKYNFDDTIIAKGLVSKIDDAMNEYGFDPKIYYKSKGIEYKIRAKEITMSQTPIKSYLISTFAKKIKYQIHELVESVTDGDKAAVITAVLTGEMQYISAELEDVLQKSGSIRFLYSAYFFIIVITTLIGCFKNKIPRQKRIYILVAAILIVGLLNSDRPVFVKSCIYLAAVLIIRKIMGYAYKPDILCAVVSVMLLANPLLIYKGGFMISVSASMLMLLFYDYIDDKLSFLKNKSLKRILICGLIYTIGLLPIIAIYYEILTPYTILTIFLYIPANLIIWTCFWPAAILFKLIGTAPVFSQLISVALYMYTKVPYIITKLPLSYIYLSRPGTIILIGAVLLVITLFLKTRNKNYKPALVAVACMAVLYTVLQIQMLNTLEITFVNVDQGDGAIVYTPYRETVIIDGGGNAYNSFNPGEDIFLPYLIKHGKAKIDAAFISHYHSDHAMGIIAAVRELKVKNLFMPDIEPDNEIRREAEMVAKENGTKIHYISEDIRLNFDSGMVIEVIVPDERTKMSDDENDTSLLMNVIYGDMNCLFTGDMTKFSENSLLMKNKVPTAEILKVAHHGSATSTGDEWLKAVDPDISIISVGEDNMYGLPNEAVLERLKDTQIYRTDYNGDITVTVNKDRIIDVETFK